jgi:hypothetical protein
MKMADQPKKTGVYNAPGSTPKSGTGMFAAVPTWAWIVAVVAVLIILAMMLF